MEPWADAAATALSEDECWRLLSTAEVGRLAVVIADEPEIFPVNFVVDGHTVVFRTAEGTKLFGLTARPNVAFEADGHGAAGEQAWSVVVKGTARRLENFTDIYEAEGLPLAPWQPGVKQWFVRIVPRMLSGVRFTMAGADPHA